MIRDGRFEKMMTAMRAAQAAADAAEA
jgi:hypothetical protein